MRLTHRVTPRTARTPRLRRALIGLALTTAFATTLAACTSGPPSAPPADQGIVLDQPTPQHVALVNQHNQPVSLASLRGKDVVLSPFLSLCQDECPLITAAFSSLQRDVQAAGLGHKLVFLVVSVDPGRDTPARLARYQTEFGANWQLWTGSAANVAAFWKPFGVSYQVIAEGRPAHSDWLTGQPLTYDVAHTDGYILIDARGHERFVDASAPNIPNLSRKLTALLNLGGLQGLRHPEPNTWTIDDARNAIGWLVQANIPAAGS
jgi:protein SCO1/2